MQPRELDVVIIGAGISGIGAGYYLQTECPDRSFTILESRDRIGGTWDLFRYPGIRSDSDMHTLGFAFKPWDGKAAIADGPSILAYLNETARDFGIDKRIEFKRRVTGASWSTADARWILTVEHKDTGKTEIIRCRFILSCGGYYRYEEGYTPDFPGLEDYQGRVVHPQKWTSDIDYRDKRVVVIGSGATAVTLVPAMAETAGHVTMLQRSPTYVVSAPERDPISEALRDRIPDGARFQAVRWKNILYMMAFYYGSQRFPKLFKKLMVGAVEKELGSHVDVGRHFTPSYAPWDQRVCLVPDGDLFRVIRDGHASVVTGEIETFTRKGILLKNGQEIEADLIVTATGLHMELFSGLDIDIDGKPLDVNGTMAYRGMMLGNVPNLAFASGYTNASWTLKVDIVCRYVCRLLNHMTKNGYDAVVPQLDPSTPETPLLAFSSGYVQRALPRLPKGGANHPWRVFENYILDRVTMRFSRVEDGVLSFSRAK